MSQCKVCKKAASPFFMNNKPVCMRCDVLLFDIEIECDEEPKQPTIQPTRPGTIPKPATSSKRN